MESARVILSTVGSGWLMKDRIAVLIIEDEPSVADALEIILDDLGYDVVVANTGSDGIAHAERRKFDVTISDLRLPDMNGLDVLSYIKAKDPGSKVIIITAHSTPEVIAQSIDLGALDVLPKPFFPSDLIRLIKNEYGE